MKLELFIYKSGEVFIFEPEETNNAIFFCDINDLEFKNKINEFIKTKHKEEKECH